MNRDSLLRDALPPDRAHRGPPGRDARADRRAPRRDQVADGGYASASVQAVAARAGVATGSVYRHFPSKADLFAEVFRRASQRELDVVAAAGADAGRPAAERIAAARRGLRPPRPGRPALAYALIAEPVDPAVEAERLRFRRGYRDAFAAVLDDGVAAGELRAARHRRSSPPRSWARSARRSSARSPPAPTAAALATTTRWSPPSSSSA